VLGVGGTRLRIAAVQAGDTTEHLAGLPRPTDYIHVVQAPTPEAAATWAEQAYQDHRAGRLADAEVHMVIRHPGKTRRALARWRKKS